MELEGEGSQTRPLTAATCGFHRMLSPARPADCAEDVEPRRSGDGDHSMLRPVARRQFQRSMTSSASRRATRSACSGGASLDVEPSCPGTHGGSIGALALEVDPAYGLGELQADPLGVPPYDLAV
jgi:hypothetical protein